MSKGKKSSPIVFSVVAIALLLVLFDHQQTRSLYVVSAVGGLAVGLYAIDVWRRLPLAAVLVALVLFGGCFWGVNTLCFVKSDRAVYREAPAVFFPMVLDGEFYDAVDQVGQRKDLVSKFSPSSLREELPKMGQYWLRSTLTYIVLAADLFALVATTHMLSDRLFRRFQIDRETDADTDASRPQRGTPDVEKRFLVALSFPGERRDLVEQVAETLVASLTRPRVFYDEYYSAELARPNLDTYLQDIYFNQSQLVVVFLCEDYENKEWCGLEFRAVRTLIKQRRDDLIMFVRLDDGAVRGVFEIDGALDARNQDAEYIARQILVRLSDQDNQP